MSYSTQPTQDAARHFEPLFDAADALDREAANDVAAARRAVDAIKAIPQFAFTEAVAAQLFAALSAKVGESSWSHTESAEMASGYADDAHDELVAP